MGPEEDQEDDQWDETPFLYGQAEKAEVVQHVEEKARERPHCSLPVPEGAYKRREREFL